MSQIEAKGPGKADIPKRRALGKGLESLLSTRASGETLAKTRTVPGEAPTPPTSFATEQGGDQRRDLGGKPRDIPVDMIDPNPYQTRMRVDEQKLEELARSIHANGVVQPIIVRPLPNGRFQLIAGERRWRASEKIGRETVPAVLRQVSDEQAMEMTIVENLQRADLNPIEQARAYERLSRDFQMTQEQMAQRTGRHGHRNFLRMLKLPRSVQDKVESGELSFGHARALLALESPESILKAVMKVTALSMSVRQTETHIHGLLNPTKKAGSQEKKALEPLDANVRAVQEHLQRQLGLKVRIEDKKGRGRIVIEYSRLEDFDSIMAMLGGTS